MEKIVALKYPVQAHGEDVREIRIPRLKLKHMRVMDEAKGDLDKMALLIGAVAGLAPSTVNELDAEDFMTLSEVLGGFLGSSQATGAT